MTLTLRQSQSEAVWRNLAICSLKLLTRVTRVTRVIKIIGIWRQREISRASFYGLDSSVMRDVGISEAQRFIEGNKPFWEA
jgi:uncharacterized protein YjiS (DUF1127 family)